jgi:hypothetical protein
MLATIIESMLPIDYYSNMVGILIDQKVFSSLIKEKIPDLCEHFESIGVDISIVSF